MNLPAHLKDGVVTHSDYFEQMNRISQTIISNTVCGLIVTVKLFSFEIYFEILEIEKNSLLLVVAITGICFMSKLNQKLLANFKLFV